MSTNHNKPKNLSSSDLGKFSSAYAQAYIGKEQLTQDDVNVIPLNLKHTSSISMVTIEEAAQRMSDSMKKMQEKTLDQQKEHITIPRRKNQP